MKDVTIARVYLKEGDKAQGHNLLRQIFRLLHDEHKVHGVTVFRGIAGFGSHGEVHADDLLRVAVHLPLVLEFFDSPEVVAAVLPRIQELVPAEHIVTWQARCGA
jgi:PII-like signaling protein